MFFVKFKNASKARIKKALSIVQEVEVIRVLSSVKILCCRGGRCTDFFSLSLIFPCNLFIDIMWSSNLLM